MSYRLWATTLVALGSALVATSCGGVAVPAGETTSPVQSTFTTSTTTVSTTSPPTTSPPGDAYLTFPPVNCCRGAGLLPGRYEAPPWFGIPLSLEVGEGWKVLNEERALLLMVGRGENVLGNPSQMIAFLDATDLTDDPAQVLAEVAEAPELTTLEGPTPVMVAGFQGVQLDSIALPNPGLEGNPAGDIPPGVQILPVIRQYFATGFNWTTSSPEARVRTIALTVGDQVLLLYLEAPNAEFDEFAPDADGILQSLETIGTDGS